MNPWYFELLLAIFRWLFTAIGGYLIGKGVIPADKAAGWITQASVGAATLAITLILAVLSRYKIRQKLMVALALPKGATENQVDAVVKSGMPPPVSVPKDTAPYLVTKSK